MVWVSAAVHCVLDGARHCRLCVGLHVPGEESGICTIHLENASTCVRVSGMWECESVNERRPDVS
eukprot:2185938-Prymnesium_polylepis.2